MHWLGYRWLMWIAYDLEALLAACRTRMHPACMYDHGSEPTDKLVEDEAQSVKVNALL